MNEHLTEHTRVDHGSDNIDPEMPLTAGPTILKSAALPRIAANKVLCQACPVLCQITAGRTGACDRWGNVDGVLTRVDPIVLAQRQSTNPDEAAVFVTGVGAGTTYPDYKPAPFIVASQHEGVDMVTVVTEGIFSYCSIKLKIDTDRFLGPEQANVRHKGEIVGHVTTAEYGSQMLSVGGVHHLTGGSRKEGRVTCDLMAALGNKQAVDLSIEGGANLIVQAGQPPIVNGAPESRMRVGCGSATIGIFAQQWFGLVDDVVVVDDHITGVLSEHQAGRCLGMSPSGIELKGRRSTPGRYFKVANPGTGWGGTDIDDPLSIIQGFDASVSWPGLRLLMVSTTGEHSAYFVLDEALHPQIAQMPAAVRQVVERVAENCEPALSTVLFVGGAGGSLRAGVTQSPVRLTRSIKDALVNVTCGGAPVYIWPGGGITVMVDVSRMPANSFGTVPTPAIVAPIEFTMRLTDYTTLGGHIESIVPLSDVWARPSKRVIRQDATNPWPIGGKALLG
ncbi:MAG: 6-hydroxynicotinate reductase [Steroidobacteraceae bacterium]